MSYAVYLWHWPLIVLVPFAKNTALSTTHKGLNEPRLPNMKGIMSAKKKTIAPATAAPAASTSSVAALELPPERAAGKIVGEGAAAVPALLKALRDEAHAL